MKTVKIQLWKNRSTLSDKFALIDEEDYEKVVEAVTSLRKDGTPRKGTGKWYAHNPQPHLGDYTYAFDGERRKSIHRVVMGNPEGMDVDHINGDRLDNRKANLRVCTKSQNSQNKKLRSDSKSGFKGVRLCPEHKKKYTSKKTGQTYVRVSKNKKPYQAYIRPPQSRSIKLGCYATAEEAARVYDKKAIELFGEFAYLNFPEEKAQRSTGE